MREDFPTYEDELLSKPFFTLREFAELCGKSGRWAYDRVYAGDIQVMKKGGTTAISSDEIRRFLSAKEPYRGKRPTPMRTTKSARPRKKPTESAKTPHAFKNLLLISPEALKSVRPAKPTSEG
ncbi:MAG: helix-turn-helix domain-containing protein [Verrucomicrobiae bacterium]|nr:helix-turn-helix domain-containing protein [Verrucomicrobiae bacterium]